MADLLIAKFKSGPIKKQMINLGDVHVITSINNELVVILFISIRKQTDFEIRRPRGIHADGDTEEIITRYVIASLHPSRIFQDELCYR
jgi:hypothetical protein